MKKILRILLILLSCSSIFAGVTVKDFFGKVKVKYDGDTTWSQIQIGQELPANTLVSTGFNSQIVLDLGNATLDVLPLTRMTLSEITESQDTIKTSLFLKGGKIKADVGQIEGKVNDFQIKSPVATASVRGTAFEFSGNTLKVIRGVVSFKPTKEEAANQPSGDDSESDDSEESNDSDEGGVAVKAGGSSQMSSPGVKPATPKAMAQSVSTVSASTKPVVVKSSTSSVVVTESSPTASEVKAVVESASVTEYANVSITVEISEDK